MIWNTGKEKHKWKKLVGTGEGAIENMDTNKQRWEKLLQPAGGIHNTSKDRHNWENLGGTGERAIQNMGEIGRGGKSWCDQQE